MGRTTINDGLNVDYTNIMPYNYKVEKVGSYYHVRRGKDLFVKSYSSLEQAVNDEAFNGLTSGRTAQETVLLKGHLTTDGALTVPNYTHLVIGEQIDHGVGAHHMITNLDASGEMVTIEGGRLVNINGGAGTYHGIYWNQTAGVAWGETQGTRFQNISILLLDYAATADAINLHSGFENNYLIHGCDLRGSRYGLNLYGVSDSTINNNYISGPSTSMFLDGGSHNEFSGFKTGGGIATSSCLDYKFDAFLIDMYGINEHGVDLFGCQYFSFSNGSIRAMGSNGYNTKYGIYVRQLADSASFESSHNQFANLCIGRSGQYNGSHDGTNLWAYGIYENDATYTDYNLYSNIDSSDTTNGNRIVGTHSKSANMLP